MSRGPSVGALMSRLKLDRAGALALKAKMNQGHVDESLKLANKLVHGYGIEAIRTRGWYGHYYQDIGLLYVNKGDTYRVTLYYDVGSKTFRIGSWGDWVEAKERRNRNWCSP